MKRRAIVIVCDGLGVGTAPDAALFGDEGKKTLQHILRDGKPHLPNLTGLGLLHTMYADAPAALPAPTGAFGRLAAAAAGKDTTTGHWELMGLTLDVPFPLYPDGFPPEVVEPFEKAIGRKVLWNKPGVGDDDPRAARRRAREDGPADPLHLRRLRLPDRRARGRRSDRRRSTRGAGTARGILKPPHQVGRVIARPFVGANGKYQRTHRRKDFSVPPSGETLLDRAARCGA